jgi:MFS family permease
VSAEGERSVRLQNPARHRRRFGRHFNRLWFGWATASTSDGLALGAVPLLALSVDPHPIAVSSVIAADFLPWLIVALPAGHFADRFDRGSISALANALRAAVIVMAVLLIVSHRMSLLLLIAVVLVNATGRAIYYSSAQAMIPDVVVTESLESANGVLTSTEFGTEGLAGPAIGSWLYSLGAALPFVADAVSLLLSCLPFSKLRSSDHEPPGAPGRMSEGVRLLFADRRLALLVMMVATLAGLQGMEAGVLVLLATTEWGVRQSAFGLFIAVGAVGSLVGSLTTKNLVSRFGSARTLIAVALCSGVGYLFMASARSWLLAAPAYVLVGAAVGVGSVVATTLRQRLTPPEVMGRVGSAWRGIVWGVTPVGALAAGALATVGGIRLPLVLAGLLQCAVALALARPLLRSIHEIRQRRTQPVHGRHAQQRRVGSPHLHLAARDVVVPPESPTLDPRQM